VLERAGNARAGQGDGAGDRSGAGKGGTKDSGRGAGDKGAGDKGAGDKGAGDKGAGDKGRSDGSEVAAVRLGISYVRTIGAELAKLIAAGRPYGGMEDVVRRCGLSAAQAEALATAGAFECFGLGRREALWAAGAIAQANPKPPTADGRAHGRSQAATLAGLVAGTEAPELPGMGPIELNRADLWATGLSPDSYPTELFRSELDARGITTAAALKDLRNGAAVTVGGVVTHRQRPATANGVIFVNLEDETGLVNVICTLPIWQRYGQVARTSPALLVRGKLEKADGAINVLAVSFEALPAFAGTAALRSRDFH
jgi:error-prone DNA polymerase